MLETSADLVAISYTDGEMGKKEAVETTSPIFCKVGSANRTEFFAAYNAGFKPELRVTTHPANYNGESIIDVFLENGVMRCDIYRTYRKSQDELELWCVKKNVSVPQVFTLWTAGKLVKLYGAYFSGTDGVTRENTGKVSTSSVTLILPQTLRAFVGNTQVGYCRPKTYAALSEAEKEAHFYIDSSCFFAVGDIDIEGKYQAINAAYDDVYLVQGVAIKNNGTPDTEYIEVTGK